MPDSPWNPTQYNRFRDERQQPFFDLIALLEPRAAPARRRSRLRHRRDDAPAARPPARRRHARPRQLRDDARRAAPPSPAPGLRFARGDIGDFAPAAEYDLIFSNAALQWLPDHAALFARLSRGARRRRAARRADADELRPPVAHASPPRSPREAPFRERARRLRHRAARCWRRSAYATLLAPARLHAASTCACRSIRTSSPRATRSSSGCAARLLTAYQRRLPPDLWPPFIERYRDRLLPELADERPYFYPFKRLLIWAAK